MTVDPGKDLEGFATGEFGNLDTKRLTAAATVPVADWLSIRAAGQIVDCDSRFGEGTGSNKIKAARVKAKLTPTDELSVLFDADWTTVEPGADQAPFRGATDQQRSRHRHAAASTASRPGVAFAGDAARNVEAGAFITSTESAAA